MVGAVNEESLSLEGAWRLENGDVKTATKSVTGIKEHMCSYVALSVSKNELMAVFPDRRNNLFVIA